MTASQLLTHMGEDPDFELFVRARMGVRAAPEKSERVLVDH
jgi:hypothetical protein